MRVPLSGLFLVTLAWLIGLVLCGHDRIEHQHAYRRHHHRLARPSSRRFTCEDNLQGNDTFRHHGSAGGNFVDQVRRTPDDINIYMQARSYISLFDSNRDGELDRNELNNVLQFPWGSEEQAWLARKVLGLTEIDAFISRMDHDGNGRVTEDEMQSFINSARQRHESQKKLNGEPAYRQASKCKQSLSSKMDNCKTEDVLRCSGYLHFAETSCMFGSQESAVERCIRENPCASICSCIAELETEAREAHSQQAKSIRQRTADSETDLQKRLIPFFLGAALTELFNLVGGIAGAATLTAAVLIAETNTIARDKAISPFLDPVIWNPKDPIPQCSTYLFWSTSCGAVLSGGARNCNPLGERVYSSSCKDHFRTGSQSCGFLGLGCRSLCWSTNTAGCSCSLFNYDVHTDTVYPGHVTASTHTRTITECSKLCTDSSTCVAFEIPPLSSKGSGYGETSNCILKDGGDDPIEQMGSTTFTKIFRAKNPRQNTCNVGRGEFDIIPYGFDWHTSLGSSFSRRDVNASIESAEELGNVSFVSLASRGLSGNKPGAQGNFVYLSYRLQQVLDRLYRSRTRPESIRNNEFLTTAGNSAWANTPSPPVQALPSQPLRNPNGGGWTWGEVQPRILNHHRRMMELGSALAFVDEARQDAEGRRQFPDRVRDMIARNDGIIRDRVGGVMHYINRSLRDPVTGENINNLQNLPDTQLPYDTNVDYIQDGGVGPIGIDAAFVLATQLAGVRYDNVHASAQAAARSGTGAGDFTGSSYFGGNSGINECLTIDTGFPQGPSTSTSVRSFGVAYQNPDMNYHADARGGYYFTFDMEPSAGSSQRNLFLFVMHTVDPASYIIQPDNDPLTSPNLEAWMPVTTDRQGNWVNTKNPPLRTGTVRRPRPGNSNAPGMNANTRAYVHAHSAVVDRDSWLDWLQLGGVGPPYYTQMRTLHFYLHPDDTDSSRLRYQNHGGQNPPGSPDDPPAKKRSGVTDVAKEDSGDFLAGNSLSLLRAQLNKMAGNILPINFALRGY